MRNDNSQQSLIVGLRALKEIVRGLSEEFEAKRKPLFELFDKFMPILQNIMTQVAANQSPLQF